MIPSLIEAALRSVLVAFAVWVGLQTFRVRNVLAQKAAWGLVLAAAVFMPMLLPLAARLPGFPARATLILPAHPMSLFAALLPARESVASALPASPLPASLASADASPMSAAHARFPCATSNAKHPFSSAKTTSRLLIATPRRQCPVRISLRRQCSRPPHPLRANLFPWSRWHGCFISPSLLRLSPECSTA